MAEALRPDAAVRLRVLDPAQSFFLRAPAGSGKTGLLVQRVLKLLTLVAQPEEILAITFTRKAAGEMLERVLAALASAAGPEPADAYARETWALARAALARDASCGWRLREQPGRLRIQTLDAFCAAIARRHPLQAGLGGLFDTTEEAAALYHEAAARTLKGGPPGAWSVLLHALDNRVDELVGAIAQLLAKREQWLPLLAGFDTEARTVAERSLAEVVRERLGEVRVALEDFRADELSAVLPEIIANTSESGHFAVLAGLAGLPAPMPQALPQWQALAKLLLTTADTPRKLLGPEQGVLKPSEARGAEKERREAFKKRVAALAASLGEAGANALALASRLPAPTYSPAAWAQVSAAVRLLIHAAAELKVVFAERGAVDFTETALAALAALGSADAPTDLLLALDYRIQHILVDEFQDTSQLQIDLLQRLTAGWSGEAGRSLFLVGDGMQSIYGFRNARVDLFREVSQEGINGLPLCNEALSSNFRASKALVEWVNAVFGRLGSPLSRGFFVPAVAARPDGQAPRWHRLADRTGEARRVVEVVAAARQAEPDGHIGILVRARSHLDAIVPALKQAGIPFQAVDVDPLGDLPVVQDLLMLTRVLLRPADRLAWLALLRAPWVGLTLAELTALAQTLGEAPWSAQSLRAAAVEWPAASAARLNRCLGVLEPALVACRRQALRPLVEAVWLGLGGPGAADAEAREAAALFLATLARHEVAGGVPEWPRFERDLRELFAPPAASAGPRLSIMTLHKAKGLEFDTVILPGLDRKAPGRGRPLLRWRAEGHRLLLSPMAARGSDKDAIDHLLDTLEAADQDAERLRLAYVALTRAKSSLHLLAVLPERPDGKAPTPAAGSLLKRLWTGVASEVLAQPVELVGLAQPVPARPCARMRLALDSPLPQWPAAPEPVASLREGELALAPPFDWAQEEARLIGVVTHRLLQHLAREGPDAWSESRIEGLAPLARNLLADLGLAVERIAEASLATLRALTQTLGDPRGRWILSPEHEAARSEWALSGQLDEALVHIQIDRSFIADGCRWIIDFKTGVHGGSDREAFLDAEQARYAPQLERYARLLARIESRPIRLALYFPRLSAWREWPWLHSK